MLQHMEPICKILQHNVFLVPLLSTTHQQNYNTITSKDQSENAASVDFLMNGRLARETILPTALSATPEPIPEVVCSAVVLGFDGPANNTSHLRIVLQC